MRRAASGALLVVLLAGTAWADGVVIPSRAVVKPVRTPDQRALVSFDGKSETIVVETTFEGAGREFAWIVPLPAKPVVEESTSGLFPTLSVMTAPRVEDEGKKGTNSLAMPLSMAALAFAVFLGTRRFRGAPLAGVGVYVAASMLIAATMISCSKSADVLVTSAPRELSRERVGAFDVAVVDPGDGSGLARWLDEHGFAAPPSVDAVAMGYAKRGWVFVAAKLTVDERPGEVRRVHPLAFTFPATEAVYPMRLTLAENPVCALEIFAVGPGTADAAGMNCEFSGELPGESESPHAELAKRGGRGHLTKLAGRFESSGATDDLKLRWTASRSVEPEPLFTFAAAAHRANECGAWTALVAGLVASIAVGSWRRGTSPIRLQWRLAAYAGAAAIGCAAIALRFRSLELLPDHANRVSDAGDPIGIRIERAMPPEARTNLATARAWAAKWSADPASGLGIHPPREEDSPGNYRLREVDGRVELVTYAANGTEMVWGLSAPR